MQSDDKFANAKVDGTDRTTVHMDALGAHTVTPFAGVIRDVRDTTDSLNFYSRVPIPPSGAVRTLQFPYRVFAGTPQGPFVRTFFGAHKTLYLLERPLRDLQE